MKKVLVLLIVCFLLLNSTAAFADYSDPFYIAGDVAFARPLGLAATIIGGAALIVCMPFALPSGSVGNTADKLVGEPFRFTFKRPLGDFSKDVSYVPAPDTEKQPKE